MLGLDHARHLTDLCLAAAAERGAHVSVAVVDAGGHLVCFARMDDAEIAGPVLAVDKAYTAVAHRSPTHELTAMVSLDGPLAGMFAADRGRYVCFAGGLPLWSRSGSASGPEFRIVGGVGVSGGSAEQDLECARAGVVAHERSEGATG